MKIDQQRRRRERYRGCRVCGAHGHKYCAECRQVLDVLSNHLPLSLRLIVDGSYLPESGRREHSGPGHGGAGLVLTTIHGDVLTWRSCSFGAPNSSSAEYQAVVRGARWAAGVMILTDSEPTCSQAMASNPILDVRFLSPHERGSAHALAHKLSVDGRNRSIATRSPPKGPGQWSRIWS